MPGDLERSELHLYTPNADQPNAVPTALSWMAGPGLYHGTLALGAAGDTAIAGAALLPYPAPGAPLGALRTAFHHVLLYRDRVLALGALDERLAYEEALPLKPGEEARGLVADPVRHTYWVYTDQTLFELRADNEERDVWRAYLDQGKHDLALKHAKVCVNKAASKLHVLIVVRRRPRSGTRCSPHRRTRSSPPASSSPRRRRTRRARRRSRR
jgi:hypothetical protein